MSLYLAVIFVLGMLGVILCWGRFQRSRRSIARFVGALCLLCAAAWTVGTPEILEFAPWDGWVANYDEQGHLKKWDQIVVSCSDNRCLNYPEKFTTSAQGTWSRIGGWGETQYTYGVEWQIVDKQRLLKQIVWVVRHWGVVAEQRVAERTYLALVDMVFVDFYLKYQKQMKNICDHPTRLQMYFKDIDCAPWEQLGLAVTSAQCQTRTWDEVK